jgi:hypothetical protein
MNMFQLTRVSHNMGFSLNQNVRYAGNRCIVYYFITFFLFVLEHGVLRTKQFSYDFFYLDQCVVEEIKQHVG